MRGAMPDKREDGGLAIVAITLALLIAYGLVEWL
jgi:hypothetical protein